jgi:hypothetical protein
MQFYNGYHTYNLGFIGINGRPKIVSVASCNLKLDTAPSFRLDPVSSTGQSQKSRQREIAGQTRNDITENISSNFSLHRILRCII